MIRLSIGLLPERFSALAEELVDEGGDAVGERVGVEQRIVEPDLEVVAAAPGGVEDAAHAVAEAAITLRKFLWHNHLATHCAMRVSLGVSEGRKSCYPLGLRLDLVVTSPLSSPTASCSHPSDVLTLACIGASPPLCEVGLPPGGGDRRGALSVLTGGPNERAASDGDRSGHDWAM